jgi:hypothetical protein
VILEAYRQRAAATLAKVRLRIAAAPAKLKQAARWVWRHRTKTTGALAIAAGSLQGFIESNPVLAGHLPGSQAMLIGFGAVVTAIGAYNTLAQIFDWQDDPT